MQNIKNRLRKFTRFVYDERLMHYASSLSFHTIMAFVPILLISFWIISKLEIFKLYYERIKAFIFSVFIPSHQDVIVSYIDGFLQNSVGLNIFSVIAVLFTSKMFFSDYEYVINKIMATKIRGFLGSLGFYLCFVVLAPMALALSLYLTNLIQNLLDASEYTSWINFISVVPYLIIWTIFCVMYIFSATNFVSFKSAAISSLFSSLAWWGGKQVFVFYVFYNKTYLSLYGSFSIMLLFFCGFISRGLYFFSD